jgi:3',5'-cyclic AMP phosphodiesterase CpdA
MTSVPPNHQPERAMRSAALQKTICCYIREIVFFVKPSGILAGETCPLRNQSMNSNEPFTLAHLTDPHLAELHGIRLKDLFNKRFFGYLKWRLKRGAGHRGEVLAGLIDDVRACRPDHIAVTGDLTHLGLPAEYLKARELLGALGAPSEVTVIPGNHDAYIAAALEHGLSHWAEYIRSDQQELVAGEPFVFDRYFPSLRVRGSVALIGVSTARPCSTFLAVGRIGQAQRQRLQEMLIETGRQGLFRVILIHHPPVNGVVSWRKRLTDAEAFRVMVRQRGAELILHGHAHRLSQARLKTPCGYAPVIGISSASAAAGHSKRQARYHLYHLSQTVHGWQVHVSVRSFVDRKGFITQDKFRLL